MKKMRKRTLIILIALCFLTVACVVGLSACKQKTITVTVNLGFDNAEPQTLTVEKNGEFYSKLSDCIPLWMWNYILDGWFDENGEEVTLDTRWDKDGTVTASWSANYRILHNIEVSDGCYAIYEDLTENYTAKLGATVTATEMRIEGYVFDADSPLNVKSATITEANTTLELYYKRIMCTVTYVKNYDGATGEMESVAYAYGDTFALNIATFQSDLPFVQWCTAANGQGEIYSGDAIIEGIKSDITLYAQWKVSYTEEVYIEQLVGGEYVYTPYGEVVMREGLLGDGASVQTTVDLPHYVLNYSKGTPDVNSLTNGAKLTAYYSLERFTVIYEEQIDSDGQVVMDTVRYGQTYALRAPVDDTIIAYRLSVGDEREYAFGETVTVTDNILVYPVRTSAPDDDE